MVNTRMESSSSSIHDALLAIVRRRRRLAGARRALVATGGWLVALLALIVADAIWALPTWGRWIALLGLIAGVVAVAGRWWREATVPAEVSLHEAHRIERVGRLPHHPLVSALQLVGQQPRCRDELARTLIERCERRAGDALERAGEVLTDERVALRRAAGWLWAVAVIWAVAGVIQPMTVSGGLARLAWPTHAQPTAGLTRLHMHIDPVEPVRGEDVQVRARAHGRPVQSAELVELDDAGRRIERWPMTAVDDGTFAYRLRDLRAPVTYRVEADGARSRPMTIEPRDPPVSRSAERQRPASDEQGAAPSASTEHAAQPGAEASAAAQALGELAQRARELGGIAEDAELPQLEEAVGGFNDALDDALDDALEQFAQQMSELATSEAGPLRDALEALELPKVGGAEAAPSADAWRTSVRDAAEADAATLEALRGDVAAGVGPAGEQVVDADSPAPEEPVAPAATGDYHQWINAAERTGLDPEAFARRIVPEYRELIDIYFRRLSADDHPPRPAADRETDEP